MSEVEFKKKHRLDVCSRCPKRVPCAAFDSICELVTPCDICEIRDECTALCEQMQAYLYRGKIKDKAIPFSQLPVIDGDGAETYVSYKFLEFTKQNKSTRPAEFTVQDIPWPAISKRDAKIVFDHFYFQKTYEEIAEQFKIDKALAYRIIQGDSKKRGALDILREYAKYRQLYRVYESKIEVHIKKFLHQYYFEYKKSSEIAELEKCSEATVSRMLQKGKTFLDECKIRSVRFKGVGG